MKYFQGTCWASRRTIRLHVRYEPLGVRQRDAIAIFERRENFPVILMLLCALLFKILKLNTLFE